ncbi:unnamed protein product [Cylicocyclus nassatus]|uniref:Follistatin-like domain-containing protein n=1 Tax=Cylicocyclus nassatus TaxID=53992 RepID=A0AA36GC33_CYLNA|nr:unnamed protein product [Cylicocyclus nassatus]
MTTYIWVLLLTVAAPSVAEYQDELILPESPCNLVDCVSGRRCIVVRGEAQCVPDNNILQTTQAPQGRCAANEVYTTCGTACEPSCRVPRPEICTLQCVIGCQCRSGLYRNDQNACVPLSSCPGNGGNGGNGGQNQCQVNEVFLECGTQCEPTCTDRNPVCNRVCAIDVCQCRQGYVRDANRRCIPVASCPAVSANTLQTAQPPQGRCSANEVYNTCGTACEPSCRVPRPEICTEQCVVGCQCRSGFYRNDQNACVQLSNCPGNGGNGGQNQCQANEVFQECGTMCEPSCADRNPVCTRDCAIDVCQCRRGYVRDANRRCIPVASCPPAPLTCATVNCITGTTCREINGRPQCVPSNQPPTTGSPLTCATVNCITGTTCRQIDGRPQCVPSNQPPTTGSPLTCATVNCITGTICQQINGRPQCVPAPSSTETYIPGSPLTCATVNCITGTTCRQINGRPQCVPITPSSTGSPLTCATVDCRTGFTCQQIGGRPQCVPNTPSSTGSPLTCATVDCRTGFTCQQIGGRPQCVPNTPSSTGSPLTCANVRCSAGTTCQLINNRPQCVPNPPSSTGSPLTCATVRCRDGFNCQQINNRPQCVPNTPSSTGSPLTCATVDCLSGFTCRQIGGRPQCVPNTPPFTGSCPLCRVGTTCRVINNRPQCVPDPPSSTGSPLTCANVRCRDGFNCQQINNRPQCVPNTPSSTGSSLTCDNVRCGEGTTCQQINGRPQCVPNPPEPSITCANVRCIGGTTCQLINNRPQCVPNTPTPRIAATETTSEEYNPCAAITCLVGQECRVRQVQCVRAPCNPIGECYTPPGDNRCPQFESFRECASYCEPTCSNRNPVCIQSCAPAKCQCNQGFYRDASGQCVTENDCDAAGAMPYRKIRL